MDIIKKPIFWIITVLVIAFVAVLGIYQGIAISFAVLSIIIATFFASRSLKLADKSLRLTRNTVRPFLSVQSGNLKAVMTSNEVILAFEISNTGSIPGEIVTINTALFDNNEVVNYDNASIKYPGISESPNQPLVFPNSTFNLSHTINTSNELGKNMWESIRNGEVKLRHSIRYKGLNTEYITIQTEQLCKSDEATLKRKPISPQYWT
jgi:hypothetical protein